MSHLPMNPVIIETFHDNDPIEWGVSFSGSNPEEQDYVRCSSKEDAIKLKAIIEHIYS